MPAQGEGEIASHVVWTDKREQMYSLKPAETLSANGSFPVVTAGRKRICHKTTTTIAITLRWLSQLWRPELERQTHLPFQVDTEAIGKEVGKNKMNGGTP